MVKYQFGFDRLSRTSSQTRNDDTQVEVEEINEDENNSNEVLSNLQSQLEDPSCSKKNVSSNVLRSIY